MFGRRKQREQQEEATREAERRALFEELAKRPDTVCPFLGLENARTEYRDRVSDGHRCYAFGEPAELSGEQQQKVCLQRGYGNCPRYLRGVLVIPTEELEALRRPKPAPPPVAPAPQPGPPPAPAPSGGGRRGLVVAVLLLLIAVGGGGAAFVLLNGPGGVASETPTPSAAPSPTSEPSPPASSASSAEPTPTPDIVTDPLDELPTPAPGDEFKNYAVVVFEGEYPVYRLNEAGDIVDTAVAEFAPAELGYSSASVELVEGADGIRYWRTTRGTYTDLAYVRGYSDGNVPFRIYEIWGPPEGSPDAGERRYRRLPRSEL